MVFLFLRAPLSRVSSGHALSSPTQRAGPWHWTAKMTFCCHFGTDIVSSHGDNYTHTYGRSFVNTKSCLKGKTYFSMKVESRCSLFSEYCLKTSGLYSLGTLGRLSWFSGRFFTRRGCMYESFTMCWSSINLLWSIFRVISKGLFLVSSYRVISP